jgi:hypothetical protein
VEADLKKTGLQLVGAGVIVLRSACGTDGLMRPAVCGASDGRIAIFAIASKDEDAARKLGFMPLKSLPEATVTKCP